VLSCSLRGCALSWTLRGCGIWLSVRTSLADVMSSTSCHRLEATPVYLVLEYLQKFTLDLVAVII
jgi:hypothetical protein